MSRTRVCYNPGRIYTPGGKMRRKDLGFVLLSIWLIVTGLNTIFRLDLIIRSDAYTVLMGFIALAAGILILLRRR
jgi:hypothetical protein